MRHKHHLPEEENSHTGSVQPIFGRAAMPGGQCTKLCETSTAFPPPTSLSPRYHRSSRNDLEQSLGPQPHLAIRILADVATAAATIFTAGFAATHFLALAVGAAGRARGPAPVHVAEAAPALEHRGHLLFVSGSCKAQVLFSPRDTQLMIKPRTKSAASIAIDMPFSLALSLSLMSQTS